MNIQDPVRAINALLGQTIEGMEVHDDGTATLTLNRAYMLIDFNDGEIYIEVKEQQ
jgi:hypothetical protein